MNFKETLRTAVTAIMARKLRSALTMLGILIGIAAVMLTVGLGLGASDQITSMINSLGSNMLIITPGSTTTTTGVRAGTGTATTLTLADATMLSDKRVAPDVAAVAPLVGTSTTVISDTSNWTTTVIGSSTGWLDVRSRTVTTGRSFTEAESIAQAPIALVGATTATNLFGSVSSIGQTIQVRGVNLTVIGELNPAGTSIAGDQDDLVLVPIGTYTQRLTSSTYTGSVTSIYLAATSQDTLSAAYQEAAAALQTTHRTTPNNQDFMISSQQSLVDTISSTTKTLTTLLAGIAGISLLVGGIGVMNIMLVSVTERTREIGLRKALGARPSAIRSQFLTEASLLGLLGGMLGVGLGMLGATLLPPVVGFELNLSLPATLIALGVSMMIGIVAGVYPATRAARLSPIDALRTE